MFTGIIKGKTSAKCSRLEGGSLKLEISKKNLNLDRLVKGDSIAINGVCLSIDNITNDSISFFLMPETLRRTTFTLDSKSININYEPSLTLQDKLDGHIVYGEVDCTAKIINVIADGASKIYTFKYDSSFADYMVNKGRITVDGISLSVINANKPGEFGVALIPLTLSSTTLGQKKIGDKVNLEFDIYAKLVLNQRRIRESKK